MYILYKKKKGKNEKLKMVKWFKSLDYLYLVKRKHNYKYYYCVDKDFKNLMEV